MTDSNARANPKNLIVTWMISGLLLALPLLFLYLGFQREYDFELRRIRLETGRDVEQSLMPFLGANSPGRFIESFWRSTWEKFSPGKMTEMGFFNLVSGLKGKYPGLFETVLFNSEGEVVASCSDLPEFHDLLGKFGRDVVTLRKGNPEPLKENFPNYVPFVGPFLSFDPNLFLGFPIGKISFNRKRAFLHLSRPILGKPWLAVWTSLPREEPAVGFRLGLENSFSPSPDYVREIVDCSKSPDEWGKNFGRASRFVPNAVLRLGNDNGKIVYESGYIWSQICISGTGKLIFCLPDRGLLHYERAVSNLRATVAGSYLLLFFVLNIIFGKWVQVSLRTKILFLFVFSTSVPLGLLGLSAKSLFYERQQILEKRLAFENEEILGEFDRKFLDVLAFLEETTKRLLGGVLTDNSMGSQAVFSSAKKLIRLLSPNLCEVFDEKGNSIFRYCKGYPENIERISPFMGIQIAREMSEMNQTTFGLKESSKEQAFLATLESVGFDLDQLTMAFKENPNVLGELKFGDDRIQNLCYLIPDVNKRSRFATLISWGNDNLEKKETAALRSFQKKIGDREMAIFSGGGRYPVEFPFESKILEMDRFASFHGVPIHWNFEENSQDYLMSAFYGLYKFANPAFITVSTASVKEEIGKTRNRLAILGFLLLGLGAVMGVLISHQLLLPIRQLAFGMEKLKGRDFSQRLPVISNDELGRLTQMFNGIMEGMADLEIAKVVQETFFPQNPLVGNGWELYGKTTSASRVGGDYFDYFPLKDGKWFLIIGDVAGHGVPAALVVAMVKALVSHPENPEKPSEILDLLNQSLLKTLHRKRTMTCILGMFDPTDGVFYASNAGHNFPQIIRETSIEEIIIPHPILGFSVRMPFENRLFPLAQRDWVCFYTDGLIEAFDLEGNQIGYERFREALPGLKRGSARETESAIREWYDRTRVPGPLPDDTSIMVLQKESIMKSPKRIGEIKPRNAP